MTRAQFQKFFEGFILVVEGGEVDDSYDPGGHTKYGISKKQYPHLDIKSLTRKQASDIYYKDYYKAFRCDTYPEPLNKVLCDMYINTSPRRVNKHLQEAINVFISYKQAGPVRRYLVTDGLIGSKTRLAVDAIVNANSARALARELLFERVDLYTDLSRFNRYGRGWVDNRVLDLKKYLRL